VLKYAASHINSDEYTSVATSNGTTIFTVKTMNFPTSRVNRCIFPNAVDAPFNVLRLYEELKYTASQANVDEQRQSLATVGD